MEQVDPMLGRSDALGRLADLNDKESLRQAYELADSIEPMPYNFEEFLLRKNVHQTRKDFDEVNAEYYEAKRNGWGYWSDPPEGKKTVSQLKGDRSVIYGFYVKAKLALDEYLEQKKAMIKEELEGLDDEDTIADMARQIQSAASTGDKNAVRRAAKNNARMIFDLRAALGRSKGPKKILIDSFADALYSFLEKHGSISALQMAAQDIIDEYEPADEDMDF